MSAAEEILEQLDITTHEHTTSDTDKTFTVDPFTRQIIAASGQKTVLIQGDHKSEIFTFTIPRYIEGHDMAACNKIYIPYINTEVEGRDPKFKSGVYTVSDITVNNDTVVLKWEVSINSTSIEGALHFMILLSCMEGSRVEYRWNTDYYENIIVKKSLYSELNFETEYLDIIEQWKETVKKVFKEYIDAEVDSHIAVVRAELEASMKADFEIYTAEVNEKFENKSKTIDETLDSFDTILETEITKLSNELTVQKARMDTFTSLGEGSTTGDAELADIRVGENGITYENAGSAVRSQFDSIISGVGRIWHINDSSTALYHHIITPFAVTKGEKIKVDIYSISPEVNTIRLFGYYDDGSEAYNIGSIELGKFIDIPDNFDSIHITFGTGEEVTITYDMRISIAKGDDVLSALIEFEESLSNIQNNISTNAASIEAQQVEIDTHDVILKDLTDVCIYFNEVDPDKITPNGYLDVTSGNIGVSEYMDVTDYIYLRRNTTYYVGNIYTANFYAFYDMNHQFVAEPNVIINANDNQWGGIIEVGESDLYFRGSFSHGAVDTVWVSKYVNEYYPYEQTSYETYIKDKLKKERLEGKKVLVLGDSISTDYYGNYKKWVTHLIDAGYLPTDTVNDSIHATGFVARYNDEENDFLTRIKAIEDPSVYDLVVVFGGVNDYIKYIPFGESGDSVTENFVPAVDEFFEYLFTNFVNARLCVLTPLQIHYGHGASPVGKVLEDYSEYIKSVARSYAIPVLDLQHESGFCPRISVFSDRWTLMPEGYDVHDGVHPNEEYEEKYLAPMIWHFIEGLI